MMSPRTQALQLGERVDRTCLLCKSERGAFVVEGLASEKKKVSDNLSFHHIRVMDNTQRVPAGGGRGSNTHTHIYIYIKILH